jgi:hypothetical protein
MEQKKIFKIAVISILCVSLATNVALLFFGVKMYKELVFARDLKQQNSRILSFANIFIEKILLAESDIDFDIRLELETCVRSLNDSEILSQWQKFTKSDSLNASREAKNLLNLLVKKSIN